MPAPRRASVAQHRLVGVGLHGVADERALAGEGLGEHAVVALERRGGIAIERRADLGRELRKAHVLGVEDPALDKGSDACSGL